MQRPCAYIIGVALILSSIMGGIHLYIGGKQSFVDSLVSIHVDRLIGLASTRQLEGLWTFLLLELVIIACFGLALLMRARFPGASNANAGRLTRWICAHQKMSGKSAGRQFS